METTEQKISSPNEKEEEPTKNGEVITGSMSVLEQAMSKAAMESAIIDGVIGMEVKDQLGNIDATKLEGANLTVILECNIVRKSKEK